MQDVEEIRNLFAASLPAAYRERYRPDVVMAHARTAQTRGSAIATAGLFETETHDLSGLCIVARDQPGLLATTTTAIVLAGFDIVDAETYTRHTDGREDEAVDLFWLRRADPSRRDERLTEAHADQIKATITSQLTGEVDAHALQQSVSAGTLAQRPTQNTRVRFIEDQSGALCTLEVETGDRSGLLLALSQALLAQRVQIVQSQVRTRGERVFDRFALVEFDGSPIAENRRLEIQVAVLSAIDPQR
jgi:[protein-PII] uridylyltransferase